MTLFEDLTAQVTDHQFATAKYGDYAGAKIGEAQGYLAAQIDFRELFDEEAYPTTAGTASYALPSDFMRNHSFLETDSNNLAQLELISFSDYELLDSTQRGRPTAYTIDRSNIKLYPTPDAAYNFLLRYYREPITLITGDEPEIPGYAHHLLVDYALSKCYEREHQLDMAQYHWGVFERDLARVKGEVQHDTNDQNQTEVVPGMWRDDTESWPSVRKP